MFSDIAGYTAMMQANEAEGKDKAQAYRKILENAVLKHQGEVIKHYGDGSLTTFQSSVEAVQCAKEVQEAIKKYDIPLRIGVHVGDISLDEDDIYGDGVNIASRVESLGIPGAVLFTGRVYEDVKNHPEFEIHALGKFHFKNDKEPRDIYTISIEKHETPTREVLLKNHQAKLKPKKLKPSFYVLTTTVIAVLVFGLSYFFPRKVQSPEGIRSLLVLPFENLTGLDNLDYFVAGMHVSLIADIQQISGLNVKSKTTSMAYQDAEKTMPEIAEELDVDVIAEVSVLCIGDSICLQVQLVGVNPDEEPLLSQTYIEETSQILNVYHWVTKEISQKINVVLTPQEEHLLAEQQTVDPEAYDAYLRGQYHWERLNLENLEKARAFFEFAIEREPAWAPPYTGLSMVWGIYKSWKMKPDSMASSRELDYLEKTLELDPNSALAHYIKAVKAVWNEWNWEMGEQEFQKSLKINPNDALCRMYYAHLLMILRRQDEVLVQAEEAFSRDPQRPLVLALFGVILIDQGDYDRAKNLAEKALSIDPKNGFVQYIMERSSYYNKDYKTCYDAWKKKALWDDDVKARMDTIFTQKDYFAVVEEAIRVNEEIYALDGRMSVYGQAGRYYQLKKYDRTLDYLELAYENQESEMAYLNTNEWLELRDFPRYQDLLRKLNFSVE
jgi:TolB-like protein